MKTGVVIINSARGAIVDEVAMVDALESNRIAVAIKGTPIIDLDDQTLPAVINRVQFGDDEIVKSKQGSGSVTTCMAYAGFRFVKAILAAKGGNTLTEEAYVYLPGASGSQKITAELGVNHFALKIELCKMGAVRALPMGKSVQE
ncbi:hypothetical protein BDV36DRAFT_290117 [Aspergillus pseudocaelatus]|uniref:malate dehydrogenase n=1 Tax=Aspergillus pseudocaelatus TaxID=1825620 RepID=A0ABQ6X5H5_9EURO|nr:hypothetical protein BDV36DRAFT_290117 [Aspergillus pseudocaelatus]